MSDPLLSHAMSDLVSRFLDSLVAWKLDKYDIDTHGSITYNKPVAGGGVNCHLVTYYPGVKDSSDDSVSNYAGLGYLYRSPNCISYTTTLVSRTKHTISMRNFLLRQK